MFPEPNFPIYKKVWGQETWITNESLYCCKYLDVLPGGRCSLHYHRKKTETFIILSGACWLTHKGRTTMMLPGDKRRINPLEEHRFQVPLKGQPCRILEVSTQHFEDDSYRLEQSILKTA